MMTRFFTGMEGEPQDLRRRMDELAITASQRCNGCEALELRVAALERRLDEKVRRPQTLEEALELGDPTDAAAGPVCSAEEPDAVDLLLREAQQLGCGVFDEDLEELLGELQPTAGGECQSVAAALATPPGPIVEEPIVEEPIMEEPIVEEPIVAPAGPIEPPPMEEGGAVAARCHLVLGDSIAKGLHLPTPPQDSVINASRSGNTWSKEARHVQEHIQEWELETAESGASPGSIFIWMGGNDVYGRPDTPPEGLNIRAVREVLAQVTPRGRTVVAGPTIRLWCDDGKCWEDTEAFQADRDLATLAQEEGATFIPYLGRAMTVMRRKHRSKRHVVDGVMAGSYFGDRLGIHLNKRGYERVMDKLGNVFWC